ncbi:BTAD domain-containing putative transcriptional regulator [Nonomuraea zeae]|uniref:AfsR/SARP family transcriptional regulator n=1 Tax=Nonomuraea zeae TaxID=1642303 RepID=A0A5S4G0R8_9ACTN|nr:BTAD domain-containing putative transcriptional regulator [Nonomuraea zeae]TMR26583.1 AfsR/SARP family transcriptional regulator [Nonomuraea zeae]
MRYGVLGTTRAWRADGTEVPLGGPVRRALLALLLLRPGAVVSQDRLIEALYGDRIPKDATHALHSQVSRLRRDGIAVELTPAGYRLPVGPGDVDAERFLVLADEGRAAGDPVRAAAVLREALALWRGAAFADLDPAHGGRLEERRLGAIEDRIEAELACGAHRAVITELDDLVGQHPLRERLRGLLMRALSADGRPAEALAAYEDGRQLLAAELGADPSPELAELHRSLLRGTAAVAPAPLTLPGRLTSFVGRDDDVAAVAPLLATARLVTLLGPGGAGKTRLAIEVARPAPGRTASFADSGSPHPASPADATSPVAAVARGAGDVVLVELAPVGTEADLAQVVLHALGVRESGLLSGPGLGAADRPDSVSRLIAALAERPLLLILDNCEHLVHAAATLSERLLAACPALRILATSREPLGITPEHLWPVRPLAPEAAAALFIDRARAVRPDFVPDEAVGRICAALDGLPLAIELAAARLRTHETGELAERLAAQDRFSLLSRGSRTSDARHQTLRAVVAWSWALLTEAEQVMAGRLTVFSGGATARAAAEVCGLAEAEELLDSLADKSLLEVSGGRYRMLETIRAFCAERLGDEAPDVRRAHATYFLDLAERAEPHLRGAGQVRWLDRLAAEHDNLQAALRWAVESGEVAFGMRLLAAQSTYLWMRGMRATTAGAAIALLEAAGPEPDPALGDAYVLCLLATTGNGAAQQIWERHRSQAETMVTDDTDESGGSGGSGGKRYPIVTYLWPMITAGTLASDVALKMLRRAARAADPWERAAARLIWAYPQMAAGEFAAAEEELTGALDGFRLLGDRWGSALALDGLAWLASVHGDDAAALAYTEQALALAEQLGAEEDLADLLCNRGDHRIGSDLEGARADYERAAELARRAALPIYLASALRGLGDVAARKGDLGRARELYEQGLRQSDPQWVKTSGNMTRLLVGLGRVAEADGDRGTARAHYRRAVEHAVRSGALAESPRAIEALAALALTDGADDVSGGGGSGGGGGGGGGQDGALLCATLLGAAIAMRGVVLPGEPEAAREARAVLGERAFAKARRAGARLSHREALRLVGVADEVVDRSPLGELTAFTGELATLSDGRPRSQPDG